MNKNNPLCAVWVYYTNVSIIYDITPHVAYPWECKRSCHFFALLLYLLCCMLVFSDPLPLPSTYFSFVVFYTSWKAFLLGSESSTGVWHLVVKNPPASAEDVGLIPAWEDLLEKEMATHSSILAWEMLWTEDPGVPCPRGHKRVVCD